jgi:hypothetical protein
MVFGQKLNNPMKYLITTILLFVSFVVSSQVITIEYLEDVIFAIEKNRGLIEQWENDGIIWGDACGFEEGKGVIRYVFDFNNMTVELGYYKSDGEVDLYGKWDIMYMISEFDYESYHFSCVANTEIGDYFYELTKTIEGDFMLFRYYNNDNKKDVWALPSLDWDKYGVGVGNADYLKIEVN